VSNTNTWKKFCDYYLHLPTLDIAIDVSKMDFQDSFLSSLEPLRIKAIKQMEELESGKIANPDENRMVGHYWLRDSKISPTSEIKNAIENAILEIKDFTKKIHAGSIKGGKNRKFQNILIIGIGGSALGPQLVSDALGNNDDEMSIYFCDNTDPDGILRLKESLQDSLDETLCIVVSKSGGTVETKNGMLEFELAYKNLGLQFSKHAIAVTCEGSKLDSYAKENEWIDQMYMWDWVGGRTSIFSQVGLLPAALQGINIDEFLAGGTIMDSITRKETEITKNPALLLASMWYFATEGKAKKDMVVLPYKDRLVLFSKYLQQLVMESLGKEKDLDGKVVHQGLSVYGNKGSTDQHAYVQQLREGVPNFFATFIEVLSDLTKETNESGLIVEDGDINSGDYLSGFFLGTRKALADNGRGSVTITINQVNPKTLGALIALFDRTVSFYASFTNINAYHQPGVEAGKKAATRVIEIQKLITTYLKNNKSKELSAEDIAKKLKLNDETETVYKILCHLSANKSKKITQTKTGNPNLDKFKS
jgi:glucose-6-phosphate isomerase